jgi:riboflavin kinase/FMN adenylyltransferase
LLEVHLFDYEDNLYGTRLDVLFVARIRAERKFSGIDALREQIEKDSAEAKHILATS